MTEAFKYVRDNKGQDTELCYPYAGKVCKTLKQKRKNIKFLIFPKNHSFSGRYLLSSATTNTEDNFPLSKNDRYNPVLFPLLFLYSSLLGVHEFYSEYMYVLRIRFQLQWCLVHVIVFLLFFFFIFVVVLWGFSIIYQVIS